MNATVTSKSGLNSDRVFGICNYLFLTIVFLLVLYPLVFVVSASLSDPNAVTSGRVWLFPVGFTLKGYAAAFKHPDLMRGFFNALTLTVLGTSINIVVTVMMAYPLSRKTFYGRNAITLIMTVTMFFGGGLVPTFLLINQLHLYNTYWALVIPGCVGITNVIICRTYFQSNIPEELYEAASLDGCSDLKFLLRVVLPLSKPVLAVLVMYYAIGHWNSYFNAMIYLEDTAKYPLQVILREIIIQNKVAAESLRDISVAEQAQGIADLLKYSTIVISSLPMMILYPFIQKHFVKGVMIGAIKG